MVKRYLFLFMFLLTLSGCEGILDSYDEHFGSTVNLWGKEYSVKNTIELDLSNTGLTGSIPSEIGDLENLERIDDKLKNEFKGKQIWIASSTHENEEFLCGLAHKIIKKHNRNIITIIIPRHIERIKTIRSNLEKMNLSTQVKGETEPIGINAEIILVNYYGSTQKYLQNFRQVFIGKSMIKKLEKVGGQNPINAAKMGCRIYHGPYVYNFKEIYNYLGEKKLAAKVGDYKDLADNLRKNFENKISIKENEVQQLHNYSEKIFDELINEYKNFINENI